MIDFDKLFNKTKEVYIMNLSDVILLRFRAFEYRPKRMKTHPTHPLDMALGVMHEQALKDGYIIPESRDNRINNMTIDNYVNKANSSKLKGELL